MMVQAMLRALCRRSLSGAAIRTMLADTRANATLELAVTLAILGPPLLFGVASAGFIIYNSIEVSSAAHAGAEYAMVSDTFAHSTSQIQAAAQAEAPDLGKNLTVATPTVYYACSSALDGTQYFTKTAAQTACLNSGLTNNQALEFVQVNTSASMQSLFPFPGLPKQWTLQGQSIMMVQE